MKSLINIDNSLFDLSKELYFLQNFANKKVEENIVDNVNKAIDILKKESNCQIIEEIYNLYFNSEIAYINEANVLGGINVSTRLKGCKKAYFFIITLGAQVDRAINKLQYTNLTLSFVLDSVASILIDVITQKIQDNLSENYNIVERFSCGYGDYPLSLQQNICNLLKADKIGVKLTNGGMFYPTKTISAVIGILGEKDV